MNTQLADERRRAITMLTEIYYFTATGNSFAVARSLAGCTAGSLVPIAAVIDRARISTNADAIGIIFPVYYASLGGEGLPLMVERFVRKLDDIGSKYIFSVCTHSGIPGDTLANLGSLLQGNGGKLSAAYAIKMSHPYGFLEKLSHALFGKELSVDARKEDEEGERLLRQSGLLIEGIADHVSSRSPEPWKTRSTMAKALSSPFLGLQRKAVITRYRKLSASQAGSLHDLVPLVDKSFRVDEGCNGCGICECVCPAGNIALVDGRPRWLGHCETCYACFQWCPREAIGGQLVEYEKRSHHPDIGLKDMCRKYPGT